MLIAELLIGDQRALGAIGIDRTQRIHTFSAGAIVLAAGGANRIYPNVVPRIAHPMYGTTGDGYRLALQAGLSLVDMEFVNFRDSPPATPIHGTYVNAKGERFMAKYDPIRKEGAPRGKVVEALFREIQAGRGPIHIEIEDRGEALEFLPEEYRSYVRAYREGKRPPVTITFQRVLGGAWIHPDASSEIDGLFVAGENAGGFHGADRLQGGAFLETQVFGRLAGMSAAEFTRSRAHKALIETMIEASLKRINTLLEKKDGPRAADFIKQIHELMWNYGSIVREAQGLTKAIGEIEEIRAALKHGMGSESFEVFTVNALAVTAEAILRGALAREESRGTHLRNDFPERKEALAGKHIALRCDARGQIQTSIVPSRSSPLS
jgi:fumarate reductase (CoM/CoB) subunit A